MSAAAEGMDAVFKALADPTRRLLLDRLRAKNGQTLGELSGRLDMARQSATQHLDLLVRANLVTVVRRGRERLHYLNPAPIHEIEERWIAGFEKPRLQVISAIRQRAEEYSVISAATSELRSEPTGSAPGFVYVTYIRASAEQTWQALTDADLTMRYWDHANVSDWQPGSTWEHRRTDRAGKVEVTGRVLVNEPPSRLVITFQAPGEEPPPEGPSIVTFLVEPYHDIVRLTVTHANVDALMFPGIQHGWPAILANLKSMLETGDVLPQEPWTMAPADRTRPTGDHA